MNKQKVIKVMKEIKDEMYLGFTTEYEDGYNKGLDTAITYIEKLIDPEEKLYTAKLKSTGEYLHYDTETDKVYHFFAYGNVAKNSENYHFTKDTLLKYNAWENEAYDINEVEE